MKAPLNPLGLFALATFLVLFAFPPGAHAQMDADLYVSAPAGLPPGEPTPMHSPGGSECGEPATLISSSPATTSEAHPDVTVVFRAAYAHTPCTGLTASLTEHQWGGITCPDGQVTGAASDGTVTYTVLFVDCGAIKNGANMPWVHLGLRHEEHYHSYGGGTFSITKDSCGEGPLRHSDWDLSPYPGSTTYGEDVVSTLRAVFYDGRNDYERDCGIHGWSMTLNGVTLTGTTARQEVDTWHSRYVVEYSFPGTLNRGTHTVTASVTENCCNGGTPSVGSASWSFTIEPGCGSLPPKLEDAQPQGTVVNDRPIISVTFRDQSLDCGVESYRMRLVYNGLRAEEVTPSLNTANGWTLTCQPAIPLLPGSYTVIAEVWEACCNRYVGRNHGVATWSFQILAAPTDTVNFSYTPLSGHSGSFDYLDSVGTTKSITVGPVSIDPFSFPLPIGIGFSYRTEPVTMTAASQPRFEYLPEQAIPVPFTPITIRLCREGDNSCPYLHPHPEGTGFRTWLTVTVTIDRQDHTVTIPLEGSYPAGVV